ncbi:MAG: hypothetical protein DMG96_16800 [Acidobacteria bacterium]|nr:MAG: hypothetical protein DMG96_16800 [Acidobacteriota bacterium]
MQRIVSFSTLNPSLIASTRSLVIPNFSRSSENEIQGEFVDSTIQLLQISSTSGFKRWMSGQ